MIRLAFHIAKFIEPELIKSDLNTPAVDRPIRTS